MKRLDNIKFLRYYRVAIKNTLMNHPELSKSDLEYLFYLESFEYFTRQQIKDGTLMCRWDIKRDQRLIRDGWLKKTDYQPNTKRGEHHKYTVTKKCKIVIGKIYKQLLGIEKITENPYINEMFKSKTTINKGYQELIRLMNRDKER